MKLFSGLSSRNLFTVSLCDTEIAIFVVCSRNMASMKKFQIIFASSNKASDTKKIVQNFFRLAIFLEQTIAFLYYKPVLTVFFCRPISYQKSWSIVVSFNYVINHQSRFPKICRERVLKDTKFLSWLKTSKLLSHRDFFSIEVYIGIFRTLPWTAY